MCYYYKPLSKDAFKIHKGNQGYKYNFESNYLTDFVNGFSHPFMPIILDEQPLEIVSAKWGLLPLWVKDEKDFRKKSNTLNAMIETAAEKPSYKNSVDQRCLVLAESFKEWKHEIINGKLEKIPYEITTPDRKPFAMAGLYSIWNDVPTFTILTAPANELMAEIHNSKKRMPVILMSDEEKLWLDKEPFRPYHNRTEIELIARALEPIIPRLF